MSWADAVDSVIRIAGKVTARSVAESLREVTAYELRRAQIPIFRFLLCLVTSATGVILFLIGVIHGLMALQLPLWAIYLGLGAIALLAGYAFTARKT